MKKRSAVQRGTFRAGLTDLAAAGTLMPAVGKTEWVLTCDRHGEMKCMDCGDQSLPRTGQRDSGRGEAWMRLTYDYLCDLLRQLDEATDMLNAGDPEGIRQLAHRVKGTSGTFGLVSIAEELARLEGVAEDDGRERTLEVVMRIREMAAARRDASAPGPPS